MKKKGNVTAKEIERYGNIVTRSLSGIPMEEEPEIIEISLIPEDVLFLCTDGFWQKINVPSICNLSLEEFKQQVEMNKDDMDDNYSFLKIDF